MDAAECSSVLFCKNSACCYSAASLFSCFNITSEKEKKSYPGQQKVKTSGKRQGFQCSLGIQGILQTATFSEEIRKHLEFLHGLPACSLEHGCWESFRNALQEDRLYG